MKTAIFQHNYIADIQRKVDKWLDEVQPIIISQSQSESEGYITLIFVFTEN